MPTALRFLNGLLPGGFAEVMARNHALAVAARSVLATALETEPPCPESMLGAMASLCLPDARRVDANASSLYADALQTTLVERFRVQVPIVPWPAPPRRLVRVSAQLYNDLPQYELLARALREALDREALEIDIGIDAESEPPKSS